MNRVIHEHEPSSTGRPIVVATRDHVHATRVQRCVLPEPGVDKNSGVMEPMEKDQLLFSKDDEQRIDQFGNFRDTEYRDPKSRSTECTH